MAQIPFEVMMSLRTEVSDLQVLYFGVSFRLVALARLKTPSWVSRI